MLRLKIQHHHNKRGTPRGGGGGGGRRRAVAYGFSGRSALVSFRCQENNTLCPPTRRLNDMNDIEREERRARGLRSELIFSATIVGGPRNCVKRE